MTPTILTRNGKLFMAVGAPGGSRITTGVLQVIADVIDFHMSRSRCRQHSPLSSPMEAGHPLSSERLLRGTEQALAKMGYTIQATDGVARVEAIVVRNGVLEGGTESRQNGKVAGY